MTTFVLNVSSRSYVLFERCYNLGRLECERTSVSLTLDRYSLPVLYISLSCNSLTISQLTVL